MNTEKVGRILIFEPSNSIIAIPLSFAPNSYNNCYAMTLNTSILILLNSSKQHHAPALANPLKNFPTIM